MRRGRSGQRRKVEEAKRVVQLALGDATRRDAPQAVKFVPTAEPIEPIQVKDASVLVLTLREAATRLGISTAEMEAMVERGTVRSVVAGWTTMVPTSEVERFRAVRP
jgi:hypothetical protein